MSAQIPETTYMCDHCGDIFLGADVFYIDDLGQWFCNECLEENANFCSLCETYYPRTTNHECNVEGANDLMDELLGRLNLAP